MAKLLVNVRRKGRGFAGSGSLRKIANKLRKTANRRTATNRSKVITREIRPPVITRESEENRRGSRRKKKRGEDQRKAGVTRPGLCEFTANEIKLLPTLRYNFGTPSATDSITFPDGSSRFRRLASIFYENIRIFRIFQYCQFQNDRSTRDG